jgi:peptidoglycan/LPS O-acetylase OafA/YrhL
MFKALRWEDWVGVVLGAWMLASPWVLGFADSKAATFNALTMGTILVLFEFMEYEEHEPAKDWFDLAAGIWLMISPLALEFTSVKSASISTFTVGLLATSLAVWASTPFDERISRWWHRRASKRNVASGQ